VNLSRVNISSRDGYYALSRVWKADEEVWVQYRLRIRVERQMSSGKAAISMDPGCWAWMSTRVRFSSMSHFTGIV
jgi:DUF1680 family protein